MTNDHDLMLVEFLNKECKMALEHKDGSFVDHLQFGNEYVRVYMPGRSGWARMLRSIMGQGNSTFPAPRTRSRSGVPAVTAQVHHGEVFPG